MTRHYYHENEDVLRKAIAAIPSVTATVDETMKQGSEVCMAAGEAVHTANLTPAMLVELRKMYNVLKGVFG